MPTSLPGAPAFILVGPKEPGNIGAAARAVLNMGFDDLRLVAPRCDLKGASRLASHASHLLDDILVYDTVAQAVAEFTLVVATTARARKDHVSAITPRELARRLPSTPSAAILFGREEFGLTNEELDHCQVVVSIPTGPQYPVLNLAQAVLLIAYELHLGAREPDAVPVTSGRFDPPERGQIDAFYRDWREYSLEIGFTDEWRVDHIMRAFQQVFDRAALNGREVSLLRGLIAQSRWAARGRPRREP